MLGASSLLLSDEGYSIPFSARFDSAATAYMHNTFGSAGNVDVTTFSCWFKAGRAGTDRCIFSAGPDANNRTQLFLNDSDKILYQNVLSGTRSAIISTSVFRDLAGWYNIVCAVDTGQGTASNRVHVYINGEEIAMANLVNTYPPEDDNTQWGAAVKHMVGAVSVDNSVPFEGYMSDVYIVNGLQLDPSSFGFTDPSWGHWRPKQYGGPLGTNGSFFNFWSSGNMGLTGYNGVDVGANYTVVQIAANDQMQDTPSNNFAVWNENDADSDLTITGGSTRAESGTNQNHSNVRSTFTMKPNTGKWYCECLNDGEIAGGTAVAFGLTTPQFKVDNTHPISSSSGFYGAYHSNGANIAANGGVTGDMDVTGTRSIWQVAYNSDNGQYWFGINNQYYEANAGTNSNPSDGTNPTATLGDGGRHGALVTADSVNNADQAMLINAGQDSTWDGRKTGQNNADLNGHGDFYYAPPTGYKAMCTENLPYPDVLPKENFGIMTYTGTGSAASHRGLGFRPNLIWGKKRGTNAQNHWWISDLIDINKQLMSDSNDGHGSEANGTAFDPNGFDSAGNDLFYNNGSPYVVYCWKGNGTANGVANTDGTIDSVVNANVEAGFSLVKYVGVDSQTTTVGHGLSKKPIIVLVKATSENGRHWRLMAFPDTFGIDATDVAKFNDGSAVADDANYWNDTPPTTSVFSVGDANDVNDTDCTFQAFCFHNVEGYSEFGVYRGNGASGSANQFDGKFYHTGFRPKWILIRNIKPNTTGDWVVFDDAREGTNPMKTNIKANSNAAEVVTSSSGYELFVDFYSNGFKLKGPGGTINANAAEYLFMCFAEVPFKYANAR